VEDWKDLIKGSKKKVGGQYGKSRGFRASKWFSKKIGQQNERFWNVPGMLKK